MVYLDSLYFPSGETEFDFFFRQKRTCYDTYYPFQIFPAKGFRQIDFEDITILYGGNGSGKSTVLNILASLIGADHSTVYNRSCFFEDYVKLCRLTYQDESFVNKEILTSDGVFDSMIDIRNMNQGIDNKRDDLFEEYYHLKEINEYNARGNSKIREELEALKSNPIENISKLKRRNMARTKTQSRFVDKALGGNLREHSNGESAFEYFISKIEGDGIYLLDEPENSLSPQKQIELVKVLQDAARFFSCQLVIATHSPFVLSLKGAKIYDMDAVPVDLKKWTELGNVRAYFDFFEKHRDEFNFGD